ncbi:MAG: 30S ribosomal protein S16 [Phycisphaeraceae bacterium JB051]
MVRIRMKRFGRRHAPYYRLCVMDQRAPRDGQAIEEVGTYDPMEKDDSKALNLKADRIQHWLSVGAQPSDTVKSLLRKAEVIPSAK